MTEKKKIRVKVKRSKLNISKILIFVLCVYLAYYFISTLLNAKITNIYITQNNTHLMSDYDIMKSAGIIDYPSFLKTSSKVIKKRILNNNYVDSVSVKKKFFGQVYINIKYYNSICIYNDKVLLSNGEYVLNNYQIYNIPKLRSYLEKELLSNFVTSFNKVDKEIINKISEIEYAQVDVDKKRFLLYMNDGNYVYITLDRIDTLNKYDEIYPKLEGKKGILNLDSGNSFEIKE